MNMDSHLTEPIRQAVACGEFQKAQLLWNGYAALLRQELPNGSVTEARLAEVRELVEWSRRVVLCARAHTQSRLDSMRDSMRVAQTYGRPRSQPAATIQTNL
jgi:RNase P/RNase MRP subunit p30